MPRRNQFRHQPYPTVPQKPPTRHVLRVDPGDVDFAQLHTRHAVRQVVLVHGTFAGDDPFAVAEILRALADQLPAGGRAFDGLADYISGKTAKHVQTLARDVGNWCKEFCQQFDDLVGGDPEVVRLAPLWSGKNDHFSRADLAVRLVCHLDRQELFGREQILLWGHSHAGNGIALLTNLLANDPAFTDRFFESCGPPKEKSWQTAHEILRSGTSPHRLARHLSVVTFETSVRYGWDTDGCHSLFHIMFDRDPEGTSSFTTKSLFPPHAFRDMLDATWGDWVQAFAISGTDVVPPTPMAVARNRQLGELLESSLEPPEATGTARLIPGNHLRFLCARWQHGTRCHTDGQNLLVDYHPCGRMLHGRPIEVSLFGHGVSTTQDWLPAHLALILRQMNLTAASSV